MTSHEVKILTARLVASPDNKIYHAGFPPAPLLALITALD
jgi:hypothetical protein